MLRYLCRAGTANAYRPDFRLPPDLAAQDISTLSRQGFIRLSSANLGYDFALVNADVRRRFFVMPKTDVHIYLSNLGRNAYSYFRSAPGLLAVVRVLKNYYRDAATSHLP